MSSSSRAVPAYASKPMPELVLQPRPHALADLEREIVRGMAARDHHRQAAERLSGANGRRAEAYLRLEESRLAHLYRSREVLLHGEEPEKKEVKAQ